MSQEDTGSNETAARESNKLSDSNQDALPEKNVLPDIFNSSDMQWITSSCTDVRLQSPVNTTSKSKTSSATSSQTLTSQTNSSEKTGKLSSLITVAASTLFKSDESMKTKTSTSSQSSKSGSNPVPIKRKGTPGRKRKYQDHEVRAFLD